MRFFILSFLFLSSAHAGWEFLPTSYQQLYETYGLFIDRQNTLIFYGQSRLWSALGGELALLGDSESEHHPQITAIATGNFGLYYTDNYRFYTQNIDARVGMSFEEALDARNRFQIALIHTSGHTSDGTLAQQPRIASPGVGAENLILRFLHDIPDQARLGIEYRPYLRSDPKMNRWVNFALFGEYFPFSTSSNSHQGTPFLATSWELWGPQNKLISTLHVQIGIYWGNHLAKKHETSFRTVLGYYHGAEPIMKVVSLLGQISEFYYCGVMLDW